MSPRALDRVEELVDRSAVAAWLKRADGRFLAMSAPFAEGLGVAAGDAHRACDRDFFPSFEVGRFRADDRLVAGTGRARVFLEPPDSLTPAAWGATIKIPLRGAAGATAGFSCSVDSLVELERLLAELDDGGTTSAGSALPDGVRRLLNQGFRERITVSGLAGTFRRHPDHLGRRFMESFGSTISDYVRARRVAWAAKRLARDGWPIAEIALDAGFCDQSHLTHAFRRVLGTTPARYRERGALPQRFRRLASDRSADATQEIRAALGLAGLRPVASNSAGLPRAR